MTKPSYFALVGIETLTLQELLACRARQNGLSPTDWTNPLDPEPPPSSGPSPLLNSDTTELTLTASNSLVYTLFTISISSANMSEGQGDINPVHSLLTGLATLSGGGTAAPNMDLGLAPDPAPGPPQAMSQDLHENDPVYDAVLAALKLNVVHWGLNVSDVELAH
ncbi:hypothetical protein BS47DRAFT_1390142 [Hydnum rufescens UP504]|uniref:Uncharacterized protein n=1 Tax=Hydnum rufescens UP504 TaxID=1448309 RepID=A0A9P6B6B2_9AGAM|nr:hypothetical protein BS47DRAFT_1390142 [Hydnum rufescens UP504]